MRESWILEKETDSFNDSSLFFFGIPIWKSHWEKKETKKLITFLTQEKEAREVTGEIIKFVFDSSGEPVRYDSL